MQFRMRGLRIVLAVIAGATLTACDPRDDGAAERQEPGRDSVVRVVTEKDFDHRRFANPLQVDNRWWPLQAGTEFVYQGTAIDGDQRIRRKVVVTVSDLVKVVDGVPAMVLWERDYNSDELVEAELAFYAQDDDGNVWHLGQYPEEYEDGKLVGAPAWVTGRQGARAGLAMLANPVPGPTYSQGWGPEVDYTDRARVYKLGQETCVALGCYQDVVVTDEFALDEPEARQLKYYAPGVGNVRVGWMGRDEEKEVLSLVSLTRLDAEAMAEVRRQVRTLDRNAYENSDAYTTTPPVEGPLPTP
jgi:hypothetical protein